MRDLPVGPAQPGARRRWAIGLFKVGLSVLVIGWVLRGVDADRLAQALRQAAPGWLLLAFGVKGLSLWLHEARTWLALPSPRPPIGAVVRTCLGVGLLNLILPARGGDVAVAAALHRRFNLPLGTAAAAIGVTSFLEAAAFAVLLAMVLLLGPSQVGLYSGLSTAGQLPLLAFGAALLGLAGVAAAVAIGRALSHQPQPTGLRGLVFRLLADTAALLGRPGPLLLHSGAAGLQVTLLALAFAAAAPAAGLPPSQALHIGAEVLTLSSFASFLFPPTWGVGPAAASKLVLGAHGHGTELAVVYAANYWLVAHLPFLAVGLPALWSTLRTERATR